MWQIRKILEFYVYSEHIPDYISVHVAETSCTLTFVHQRRQKYEGNLKCLWTGNEDLQVPFLSGIIFIFHHSAHVVQHRPTMIHWESLFWVLKITVYCAFGLHLRKIASLQETFWGLGIDESQMVLSQVKKAVGVADCASTWQFLPQKTHLWGHALLW